MNNKNIGYWEEVLKAPTPSYTKLFEAERDAILKNIKPDSKVLDVGCGDGRNMRTIIEKTPFVTGCDNDPSAVKGAEKAFAGISSVRVIQADAASLPFDAESFDVITFLMILPNLDSQKEKALKEANRVLKASGSLILSTFSETAFDERMKIYRQVKAPIVRIEGTKVIFDKSLVANTSEQFSLPELQGLAESARFKIKNVEKVTDLAYVCILKKF